MRLDGIPRAFYALNANLSMSQTRVISQTCVMLCYDGIYYREVLGHFLTLNHERYAEEVRQGLHDKGAKKSKGKSGKGSISAGASENLAMEME